MRRALRQIRRGFTLIEVSVVLLIVALLFGAVLPSISNMTGAATRAEIGRLAANIRATRGQASMTGQTCRMVFQLDADDEDQVTYAVECAKGRVAAKREEERNDRSDSDEEEEIDLARLSDRERARREVMQKAAFAKASIIAPQKLPEGVRFASIWTAHQEEPFKKGKAFLYFYPSGMSERANIQIEDGDDAWTIQVSPLAGRVRVLPDKVELKDMDEED